MNHVQNRLPEYLAHELDRHEQAEIEAHIQECTSCREEYDTLLRLWSKLGTLPEEKPSERVRSRFFAMMAAYEEGLRDSAESPAPFLAAVNRMVARIWPHQPAVQFALSVLLLVLGMYGGSRMFETGESHQAELYQLRGEVRQMSHLLTLSLLNQQSASERLRGVAWTYQMENPDEQVLSALIRALKYDSNVNVRLAAVDALGNFLGDPNVQNEVLETLPRESSPMVQIALVDLLVQERVKQSADILERMRRDPDVNALVKNRIEAGLKELTL